METIIQIHSGIYQRVPRTIVEDLPDISSARNRACELATAEAQIQTLYGMLTANGYASFLFNGVVGSFRVNYDRSTNKSSIEDTNLFIFYNG